MKANTNRTFKEGNFGIIYPQIEHTKTINKLKIKKN